MEKRYELKTLADIHAVITPKNVDIFLKDFEAWIRLSLLIKAVGATVVEEVNPATFLWIDDGKNDITINIRPKP
jgi:hypothetical protein